MSEQLFEHINEFIEINEKDFHEILTFFDLCGVNKKEIIVEADNKCNFNHFVVNGCLHMFYVNDKGKGIKRTIQFAIENWWMTESKS